MTRRLILMRHAKSGWDDPLLADHDRPLSPRGQRNARALGDWLRARSHIPDQALVSSALRTRLTFDGLGLDLAPDLDPGLYHAGPERLLAALRRATGHCVLLLAHNPGIAEFAARLVARRPDHPRFLDYPTGATLVAELPLEDWRNARLHNAQPVDFIVPRAFPS